MKILSSAGFKNFKGFIDQKFSKILYLILFDDGTFIKATEDHEFMLCDESWIIAKDIEPFTELFGNKIVDDIHVIENENVYDAFDVEDTHDYYTNGVISHNCNLLYVDETAIIPNNLAEEFFTSVYPTISAGETTKILLSSTPLGYNHFWKFWNDAENGRNGFVPLFIPYTEIPGRDAKWAEGQRRLLGEIKFNQEVLCKFLGSAATLIAADVIGNMSPKAPIYSKDGLDIYERVQKDHSYVLVADTAKGVGGDYSAFSIIDTTQMPYLLVGKYRDNQISPLLYPSVIYKIAKEYNNAYVLIEINSSEQVAEILYSEYEYENIVFVNRMTNGQIVSGGFGGGKSQLGVITDKKIKRIGCSNLKSLVEEQKLLLHDADIISEISTFIEKRGSYSADEGYHDDLVMTLVLFSWLSTNPYFKELTNINIRKELYEKRIELIENEITPFGIIDDGQEENTFVDASGQVWTQDEKYKSDFL